MMHGIRGVQKKDCIAPVFDVWGMALSEVAEERQLAYAAPVSAVYRPFHNKYAGIEKFNFPPQKAWQTQLYPGLHGLSDDYPEDIAPAGFIALSQFGSGGGIFTHGSRAVYIDGVQKYVIYACCEDDTVITTLDAWTKVDITNKTSEAIWNHINFETSDGEVAMGGMTPWGPGTPESITLAIASGCTWTTMRPANFQFGMYYASFSDYTIEGTSSRFGLERWVVSRYMYDDDPDYRWYTSYLAGGVGDEWEPVLPSVRSYIQSIHNSDDDPDEPWWISRYYHSGTRYTPPGDPLGTFSTRIRWGVGKWQNERFDHPNPGDDRPRDGTYYVGVSVRPRLLNEEVGTILYDSDASLIDGRRMEMCVCYNRVLGSHLAIFTNALLDAHGQYYDTEDPDSAGEGVVIYDGTRLREITAPSALWPEDESQGFGIPTFITRDRDGNVYYGSECWIRKDLPDGSKSWELIAPRRDVYDEHQVAFSDWLADGEDPAQLSDVWFKQPQIPRYGLQILPTKDWIQLRHFRGNMSMSDQNVAGVIDDITYIAISKNRGSIVAESNSPGMYQQFVYILNWSISPTGLIKVPHLHAGDPSPSDPEISWLASRAYTAQDRTKLVAKVSEDGITPGPLYFDTEMETCNQGADIPPNGTYIEFVYSNPYDQALEGCLANSVEPTEPNQVMRYGQRAFSTPGGVFNWDVAELPKCCGCSKEDGTGPVFY